MKNDVSHHGILLNLIFAQFCRIFPGKTGFRIRKIGYPIQNLFVLKHIWVKVSISWKFQPNRSNNTLKTGFFRISGKSGSRIRNFFGLKPSRDQDGANKKKFSQIGPAVPEEIGHKQASKQTSCCYIREKGWKREVGKQEKGRQDHFNNEGLHKLLVKALSFFELP